MDTEKTTYVLMTAARNEEEFIEKTLQSVVEQTVLPRKWVIVSDGSTDRTDEIVREYAEKYPWIALVRREPDKQRNFGSKALALREAMPLIETVGYDFIGNLDADVSFEETYFENLFAFFEAEPELGLGGGKIYNKHKDGFKKEMSTDSAVAGAVQMFRRQCFEDVGGYLPISTGGIDTVAEVHGEDERLEDPVFWEPTGEPLSPNRNRHAPSLSCPA